MLHHYARRSTLLPLGYQRWAIGAFARPEPSAKARFERVDADGVPGAWILPEGTDEGRVLYYLHGGGYSIGSVASHRAFITRLARALGARAFAIDYRLAPEHPFPAAVDDAVLAWRWLLAQGLCASRLSLVGDSAGGGLVLATLVVEWWHLPVETIGTRFGGIPQALPSLALPERGGVPAVLRDTPGADAVVLATGSGRSGSVLLFGSATDRWTSVMGPPGQARALVLAEGRWWALSEVDGVVSLWSLPT